MDRQRIVVQRKAGIDEEEQGESDDNDEDHSAKDDESDAESVEGSEGSFALIVTTKSLLAQLTSRKFSAENNGGTEECRCWQRSCCQQCSSNSWRRAKQPAEASNAEAAEVPSASKEELPSTTEKPAAPVTLHREETTRSLGLRLLDLDLGYSSDEAGDEESAYFLDGVDDTFTSKIETDDFAEKKAKVKDKKKQAESKDATIPASKTEFSALGDRGKLAVAVALSNKAPSADDFEGSP